MYVRYKSTAEVVIRPWNKLWSAFIGEWVAQSNVRLNARRTFYVGTRIYQGYWSINHKDIIIPQIFSWTGWVFTEILSQAALTKALLILALDYWFMGASHRAQTCITLISVLVAKKSQILCVYLHNICPYWKLGQ